MLLCFFFSFCNAFILYYDREVLIELLGDWNSGNVDAICFSLEVHGIALSYMFYP